MDGKIIKCISNDYFIKTNDGIIVCKPRGIFRKQKIIPLVGDNVIIDKEKKVIEEIKKRKNELIRPPVSNIDIALIVMSVSNPKFNSNLLDKMLNIIEFNNIKPIIIFTKLDLLDELKETKDIINYYKKIGYEVYSNNEIKEIKKIFKDKVTILTGQTGVGKSTLLNRLSPSLKLQTNEISKALGRGKHTTRVVTLYELFDGLIADTPGFSSLDFINMTREDIRDNFIEFNKYRELCKYKDCMHINEENCEIKRKVNEGKILKSRYENYKKFLKDR